MEAPLYKHPFSHLGKSSQLQQRAEWCLQCSVRGGAALAQQTNVNPSECAEWREVTRGEEQRWNKKRGRILFVVRNVHLTLQNKCSFLEEECRELFTHCTWRSNARLCCFGVFLEEPQSAAAWDMILQLWQINWRGITSMWQYLLSQHCLDHNFTIFLNLSNPGND